MRSGLKARRCVEADRKYHRQRPGQLSGPSSCFSSCQCRGWGGAVGAARRQIWPKKCQYENPPLAVLAKVARLSDGFCHYNRTLPQEGIILESLIWHALHHAFLAKQIVEKRWITLPDWARSPCSNVAVFAAHVERNASSYRRK